MLGETSALASAVAFALGGAFTTSLSRRMGALPLNGWRAAIGAVLYLVALMALGKWHELIHIPAPALLALLSSIVIGALVGTTLFIKSLSLIGLSRAMPIASSYPLFTTLIAILFLHEGLSWGLILAAPLVVSGVWLLAMPAQRAEPQECAIPVRSTSQASLGGVGMALATAICWGIAAALLKPGVEGTDLVAANLVRMGALAILALGAAGPKRSISEFRELKPKNLLLLIAAGVLEYGAGAFLYILAVQQAGAARTAILSSVAPLFALPLGLLFLKERITVGRVWGVLFCTAGIVMVFC